jgi:hypothetical protein
MHLGSWVIHFILSHFIIRLLTIFLDATHRQRVAASPFSRKHNYGQRFLLNLRRAAARFTLIDVDLAMTNEFHALDGDCSTLVPSGPGYEVHAVLGSQPGQPEATVIGSAYLTLSFGYYFRNLVRRVRV